VVAALWFVVWVASAVWAARVIPTVQADGSTLSRDAAVSGLAILGLAALGTLASAAWLASRRRWWVIALLVVYVTGLSFAWYTTAMFAVPIPVGQPDTQDNAAAVGVVFLAIPTVVAVGLLALVGAGLGVAVRAVRRRAAR
jgi:hypothetical protein